MLRTELREANALAEQVFELAQQFGTAERMLVAHRVMATSLFHLGRIDDARRLFTAGLAFWDPGLSADYTVAYGEDPGLFCCVYAAWCDDFVGFRDEALVRMRRSLDHGRGQPTGMVSRSRLATPQCYTSFGANPNVWRALRRRGSNFAERRHRTMAGALPNLSRLGTRRRGHHADGLGERGRG